MTAWCLQAMLYIKYWIIKCYFPSFYSDLGDISIYTVLTGIYAKRIDIVEFSIKSVKPPFCFTVTMLQAYVAYLCYTTFWTLEHLFMEKSFLKNYLIFSKSILWQPVMYSRVHFSISFTLHSLVHFSTNYIKRRHCNGYVQGS